MEDLDPLTGHGDFELLDGESGFEGIELGDGAVEIGLAGNALSRKGENSVVLLFCFVELGASFSESTPCSVEFGGGEFDLGLDIRIVEAREDLVGFHAHAFFDENFDNLTGDFGGDGGLAASDDVTAGVEDHRGGVGGGVEDGSGNNRWRTTTDEAERGSSRDNNQDEPRDSAASGGWSMGVVAAVDAQGSQAGWVLSHNVSWGEQTAFWVGGQASHEGAERGLENCGGRAE